MPCYDPVGTYRSDGSQAVRPCGMCLGCRLEYSRQWAVRCLHESKLYNDNCFLTLTYNNENLPKDLSVSLEELQKFLKRFRRKIEPNKIRYFGCGEYGEKQAKKYGGNLGRPHYHLCVFGFDFPDKKLLKAGEVRRWRSRFFKGNNSDLYISESLQEMWKKGFHTIGEVTFNSAGYVARYVTKKLKLTPTQIKRTGKTLDDHYQGREPEFAIMSKRPGLGAKWIEKYWNSIYPRDFIMLNGHKHKPGRYYDDYLKKHNYELYEKVVEKRRIHGENKDFESELRGYQRECHRKEITKTLERKLK